MLVKFFIILCLIIINFVIWKRTSLSQNAKYAITIISVILALIIVQLNINVKLPTKEDKASQPLTVATTEAETEATTLSVDKNALPLYSSDIKRAMNNLSDYIKDGTEILWRDFIYIDNLECYDSNISLNCNTYNMDYNVNCDAYTIGKNNGEQLQEIQLTLTGDGLNTEKGKELIKMHTAEVFTGLYAEKGKTYAEDLLSTLSSEGDSKAKKITVENGTTLELQYSVGRTTTCLVEIYNKQFIKEFN